MVKHIYPLIVLLSFSIQLFAQEASIPTKFSQDGNMQQSESKSSETIAEFKENQKCIITAYLGNYTYKVKYKDLVGFVNDQYLFVNEQMMDLYFDHEEAQREKAIQERKQRQNKVGAIAKQAQDKLDLKEKQRIDSIAKIEAEKQNRLLEIKRNDSIVKAKEEQRLQQIEQVKKDALVKASKEQERLLEEKQKKDSIAKAKVEAQKQIELQKQKKAIAKTKAKEEAQKQVELEKRKEAIKNEQIAERKKDSLALIVKEQNRILEEKKRNDSIISSANKQAKKQLEIQKQEKAIAKTKAKEKKQLEIQKKKDALAIAEKEKQVALEASKKRNDELTKAEANNAIQNEQQKLLVEKKRYDSIIKIREQESKHLIKLKRQNDSIAKIIELERKELETLRANNKNTQGNTNSVAISKEEKQKRALLERMKYRDSCHYQINEYDKFYNITTIRTEPYSLGNNLTVELYKQSRKENVFFNYTGDLGCASYLPNQRSSVKVTLENNKVIAFYHSWDIECGDTFLFKARLTTTQIDLLKTSPIKSIAIRGTEGSTEIKFIDYKEFFIDKLKCIE